MGLVTHGILNMPLPDDPSEIDLVTWVQVKSAMREASREIRLLQALVVQHSDLTRHSQVGPQEIQEVLERAHDEAI